MHEEGFTLRRAPDGTVRVCRPDGRPLPAAPPAPRWETGGVRDPLAPSAAAGIRIGPNTATPDWFGERLDLHYALEVLRDLPAALASRAGVSAETSAGY